MWRALALPEHVDVRHHRGDRRIVGEPRDVVRDLADGLVQLANDLGVGCALARRLRRRRPEPVEEAPDAGYRLVAEVTALLVRTKEHEVRAEGARAPLFVVLIGVDDVAF